MGLFSIDTKTLLYQLLGRKVLFKVVKNHSKCVSIFSYSCYSSVRAKQIDSVKISVNTYSGLQINC